MKKGLLFLMCICLLALTGCFPTGKQAPTKTTGSQTSGALASTPSSVDKELAKNLVVKADVSVPDQMTFKTTAAALKEFDSDTASQTFLGGKTVSQTHDVIDPFDAKKITGKSIQCTDGSGLSVTPGNIYYSTEYFNERQYSSVIFGSNYFVRSDINTVYKKSQLDQVNKEGSVAIVKRVISSLGITVEDSPAIISLDYETLQSEWEEGDQEGPKGKSILRWEKADEAYVVVFTVLFDHTPITKTGYTVSGGGSAIGSRIIGIVTKNGLIYFQCNGIYDVGKTVKDSIIPVSLSSALDQVKNKYKDTMLTDPVIITHIALEYVPQITDKNQFKLVPTWVFTASQTTTVQDAKKGTIKNTTNFPIIILAETGPELRIGGIS